MTSPTFQDVAEIIAPMEDITAVEGTRRTVKELSDGTLRVVIDVEPMDKKKFLELFPEIDTPIAMAPLKYGNR